MGIRAWFKALFGRGRASVRSLQRQLLALDQQQTSLRNRLKQVESERQQLYVKGIRASDERDKLDAARRVYELESTIRHYDSLIAQLETQKNNLNALIRATEARQLAADPAEQEQRQKQVETLTAQVRVSQQRLAESQANISAMEASRIETTPEGPAELQRILEAMKTPGITPEKLPKIEKEKE